MTTQAKAERRAYLLRAVAEQRRWIEEHGNDLAGYVARYGEATSWDGQTDDAGGAAIYEADKARLANLERELAELLPTTRGEFTNAVRDILR